MNVPIYIVLMFIIVFFIVLICHSQIESFSQCTIGQYDNGTHQTYQYDNDIYENLSNDNIVPIIKIFQFYKKQFNTPIIFNTHNSTLSNHHNYEFLNYFINYFINNLNIIGNKIFNHYIFSFELKNIEDFSLLLV